MPGDSSCPDRVRERDPAVAAIVGIDAGRECVTEPGSPAPACGRAAAGRHASAAAAAEPAAATAATTAVDRASSTTAAADAELAVDAVLADAVGRSSGAADALRPTGPAAGVALDRRGSAVLAAPDAGGSAAEAARAATTATDHDAVLEVGAVDPDVGRASAARTREVAAGTVDRREPARSRRR